MPFTFPSAEWVDELVKILNSDEIYEKAASTWEGDMNFFIESVPGRVESAVIYLDLWHGKCRNAHFCDESGMVSSAFRINAPLKNWKRVITKQIAPIPALVSGQLKVYGNLAYIIRHVNAANRLVDCATQVPTIFPD